MSPADEARPEREPMFNAPWPAALLAATLVGCFLLQEMTGPEWWGQFAFAPVLLPAGEVWLLLTTQFLHGSWAHVLMNATGALAFGAPVARLFGRGARGVIVFFVFSALCGVAAILGYGLLHPQEPGIVIGASGAVSGLMGAAGRLIDRRGWLGPVWSRTAIGFAVAWTAVNLIVGLTGFAPGAGDARIAWEAHLVGFFVGLLTVGLFARLARPVYQPPH